MKIADFGISKRALEGQTELRTQIGTQGYMAPEILGLVDEAKLDSTYSSAVDIWSLGCLLYYLLTKETPFSEYEALRDYVKGYTEFPGGPLIEKGIGSSARAFIKALLAPAPESRPEASADMMADWVVGHDTGPTDTALMPAESPKGTQGATVDSVLRSPVEPQEDPTSPIASDVEEEEDEEEEMVHRRHTADSTNYIPGLLLLRTMAHRKVHQNQNRQRRASNPNPRPRRKPQHPARRFQRPPSSCGARQPRMGRGPTRIRRESRDHNPATPRDGPASGDLSG